MSRVEPNISLGVRPFEAEDPADTINKALTMRDLLQRGELTRQQIALGQENARRVGLENQALDRKNKGDAAVNATVPKYTSIDPDSGKFSIDHDGVVADLSRQGFVEHAMAYSKSQKEVEDNAYNATLHKLKLGDDKAVGIGKLAQTVLNAAPELRPLLWNAAIAQAKQRGFADDQSLSKLGVMPEYTSQMEALAQQLADAASDNPYKALHDRMEESRAAAKNTREETTTTATVAKDTAETLAKNIESESRLLGSAKDQPSWDNARSQLTPDRRKLYPAEFSEDRRKAAVFMGMNPDTREAIDTAKNEAELAQHAADSDPKISGPAKAALKIMKEQTISIEQAKEIARVNAEMGVFGAAAGTTPQGQLALANPPQFQSTRNEQMLQGMPQIAETVKGIADYKIPLPTGMALRSPYWQRMLQIVAQYDPQFDASQYGVRFAARKDFTSGKAATSVRALNTVTQHLSRLNASIDKLDNFGGDTVLPVGANWLRNATSNKEAQGQFNTDAEAVATELEKAYRGTNTSSGDIKNWKNSMSVDASKDVQKNNLKEVANLLKGQIESLHDQYEKAMGRPADFNLLNKPARDTLKKLGIDPNEIEPDRTAAQPVTPAPVATAAPGAKVITPDVMAKMRAANKGVSDADIIAGLKSRGYTQ